MKLKRYCKANDLNWAAVAEIPSVLKSKNIEVRTVSVEIERYPDTISFDTLSQAHDEVKSNGLSDSFWISLSCKRLDEKKDDETEAYLTKLGLDPTAYFTDFDLYLARSGTMQYAQVSGARLEEADAIFSYLGLEPEEPRVLEETPARSAFIAHKFDDAGSDLANKLARFLELMGFSVVTGRGYSPGSISEKVRKRIEEQEVVFVLLTPGDDQTWLTQESIIAEVSGKPLFVIKERGAEFTPGVLADHEYIPFETPHVEGTFIPILEGLRDLGYAP